MEKPTQSPDVQSLQPLVGTWTLEATHPAYPSSVVRGRAEFEWLEGEQFLLQRSRSDHPDFPDSLSVIGVTDERLSMHYFDSRGVYRVYETALREGSLRIWRDAPGFSQRFAGTFEDDGDTIVGTWELSRDDETWDDDLQITYRRAAE